MQLDLPTLMMMGSFASACAGVVLLVAWWQNRKAPALALWGLGNFVDTAGIFCLLVGPVLHRLAKLTHKLWDKVAVQFQKLESDLERASSDQLAAECERVSKQVAGLIGTDETTQAPSVRKKDF